MLAIKECLIREGVLNLTSTANQGSGGPGGVEKRVGGVDSSALSNGAAVAGVAATTNTNNTNIYGNKFSDSAAVSNNLRAISANYTYNNENRNNRYNDEMTAAATTTTTTLALDSQLAKLSDQKSVDTTHSPNTNNENKSSNCSLSSASVTAKSSCQQTSSVYDKIRHHQQQQQQLQQQLQQQQQQQQCHQSSKHYSKEQQQQEPGAKSSSSTRYHGVHPHFHHHTAPAYYTDVNLHIHTPKANDVTSLNENYQSVYNTPTQLVKEHYFPKTSTATVVPPPIGTGAAVIGRASTTSPSSVDKRDRDCDRDRERNKAPINPIDSNTSSRSVNTAAARAAFFRGGSAGSSGYNDSERRNHEPLAKSSPAFGRPIETDL